MPGPRFFAYCYRLTVYQGVIANIWRRQQTRKTSSGHASGTRTLSLAEWASEHPEAMQEAYQRLAEQGR